MSTDEGTYTCIAENRVGKVEASATLTVRGKCWVMGKGLQYSVVLFSKMVQIQWFWVEIIAGRF